MKKIKLTLLFIIIFTNLSAQNIISFQKVIKTDSIGKANIFILVNDWIATNYNSANEVIQMADKNAGIIIGKGSMEYYYKANSSCNGNINYSIKIYIKNNRYKVILSDFNHTGLSIDLGVITTADYFTNKGAYKKYKNKVWNDIKLKTEQYSNEIFNSLENVTNNKNNNDDW